MPLAGSVRAVFKLRGRGRGDGMPVMHRWRHVDHAILYTLMLYISTYIHTFIHVVRLILFFFFRNFGTCVQYIRYLPQSADDQG